ncbi:hypothetical protein [Candidatus Methanomethylophilus sp. 1R26]|uniref:hypothetical protein n=1 Tax=Candidatus Methanomethylophilus sp. 1R26 TaxID=1769296 RepID=UPI0019109E4C|nr:hypothetical protein [Candidatus Methanomethylophilus sp. 1R26]
MTSSAVAKTKRPVEVWEDVESMESTAEVLIPSDPLDRSWGRRRPYPSPRSPRSRGGTSSSSGLRAPGNR